jgi:hypothetical protein
MCEPGGALASETLLMTSLPSLRLSQASESFVTAALHICESTPTRHFENEHEMP